MCSSDLFQGHRPAREVARGPRPAPDPRGGARQERRLHAPDPVQPGHLDLPDRHHRHPRLRGALGAGNIYRFMESVLYIVY